MAAAVNGYQVSDQPALQFHVAGVPVGQGELSHVGRGVLVYGNAKRLKPWRKAIGEAATRARRHTPDPDLFPLDGPLAVDVTFTVVKPDGAPKTRRTWPCTRSTGDLDHLVRALGDALQAAGIIVDDSRIVEFRGGPRKVYPGEHPQALPGPGLVCRLWRVVDDQLQLDDGPAEAAVTVP